MSTFALQNPARPYYPPRTVQYDVNLTNPPAPPPPTWSLWEYRMFQASELNDKTGSPLDQQYGTRYPASEVTRTIDLPKPTQAQVAVPWVDPNLWKPKPAQRHTLPPVDQYRPNGQLGLVWGDPEFQEQRRIENIHEVADYIRAMQGL